MKQLSWALFLVLVLAACGSGGGDSTAPQNVDVTGTWSGTYNSSASGPQQAVMNLTEDGSTITGTFSSSTGATGDITGTIRGQDLDFTITITTAGCSGDYSCSASVNMTNNPETMSFSYQGSSTCGGSENGTGNLTKQK